MIGECLPGLRDATKHLSCRLYLNPWAPDLSTAVGTLAFDLNGVLKICVDGHTVEPMTWVAELNWWPGSLLSSEPRSVQVLLCTTIYEA